ncbi:hypothetical protein EYF80_055561 [Liparis tanakae]|uniref:Uncharacterized protein n=1 Tax=Liparis tanakae TaxID=230148 RepID=A0A4Z2EZ83_9TELE|nr:hypothetical protein EYF80_055561 [Liparis tanakae]
MVQLHNNTAARSHAHILQGISIFTSIQWSVVPHNTRPGDRNGPGNGPDATLMFSCSPRLTGTPAACRREPPARVHSVILRDDTGQHTVRMRLQWRVAPCGPARADCGNCPSTRAPLC